MEGNNFEVDGEHVKIKTPGEIYFTSDLNLNFNVDDKVQFLASHITFEALGSTTINSQLSNVHFEAGDSFSIEGSDLSLFAESGARILSQQEDLNIYSETTTTLSAENIQLDGISQSALIAQTGNITANAVNIDIESDRTIAGSSNIFISTYQPDSDLSVISFGVIQSTSSAVSLSAANVDLASSDQVKFTSTNSITFSTIGDTVFTSDTSDYYSYRDTTIQSTERTLSVDLTGGADMQSVNGDYNINSPTLIDIQSFNTDINSIESFSLSSDDLNVQASNYIDFLSEGDLNITTSIFSITTHEFEVFARENAQLSSSGSAVFSSSVNPLNVESSADIIISPRSGLFTNDADSIEYKSLNQLFINSDDDIFFNATTSTLIQTRGGILMRATRDLDVNADTVTMDALNTNIFTSQLTIDAYSATFTTSSIGEFSLATKTTTGDISFTSTGPQGSVVYQAIGDIEWSSQSNTNFILQDGFDFIANDVVFSGENSITYTGDDLAFTSPAIYGLIQSTLTGDDVINFVGDTSFTAPTSRSNEVSLTSPQQTYNFFYALISGGETTINTADASFATGTSMTISSGSEQDINFNANFEQQFTGTRSGWEFNDINVQSSTLTINVNDFYNQANNIYLTSADSTSFTSRNYIQTNGRSILYEGDSGITNTITGSYYQYFNDAAVFRAGSNNFNSAFTFSLSTGYFNVKAPENTLVSYQDSLVISSSTDIHSIFHVIDMELQSDMSITGNNGFTIDATNNINMFSDNNIDVTSPSGITAEGGDITLQGDDFVNILNIGDVTIGSNLPSISSPNYHTVTIHADDDIIGHSGGPLDIYASGNEEYFDEAITVDVSGLFSLTSAGDIFVSGDNGINVDYITLSVTSSDFIYFVAENGDITVITEGQASSLDFQSTVGSIAYVSYDAGLSQIAFENILYSATQDFTSAAVENSKIKTLYDASPVTVDANTGALGISIDGDYTASNGDAQSLQGSLDIVAASQVQITTQDDLRFHSLDHDENEPAIQFIATNTLFPLDTNSRYEVDITNAINYFPAGNVQVRGVDATFTATAGSYSFGTTQGDAVFSSNSLFYNSQHDYNVTAGGVNGDIVSLYQQTSTYTAASNYNVFSNASTAIESDLSTMGVTAGRHVKFTTYSEETGVYGAAQDATFQSLSTTDITGVNVTGHALTFSSIASTNAITTHFTIGQNNAQFNPQINGQVNSWHVTSLGSNAISAINDDIKIDSGDYVSNAGSNTIIKAGGALEFTTRWDSLNPGDGILSINSDLGQITATAQNYIDYHVRRDGSIHSDGRAQILSSGTSTSSPSTSGILFKGTNGNVAFNSLTTFSEDIATTTVMDIGDNGVYVQADQSIALTASTGYSLLRSDKYIYADSIFDTAVATTGNNARMEFTTTGRRAPIQLHGDAVTINTIVNSVEFNGDNIVQFARDDLTVVTGANNNGQLTFDSTGDFIASADLDVSFSTLSDFFIDAAGVGSDFHIQTAQEFTIHSDLDTTFSTTPNEGGSIRFHLDDNEFLDVTGNTWTVESDVDLNVNTNGSFVFSTGGRFESSITGYIDINSNHSLYLRSHDSAQSADVVFHADNGDVLFTSIQSTDFVAGANGYGNATFVIDGNAHFTANGNFSGSSSSSLLIESLLGDSVFNSLKGDLNVQAYERLSLLAFGAATDTGYIKFVSRSPKTNNNGIVIESTHTGGDIFMTGIGGVFAAHDISYVATGTTSESGFISIVNDWESGKGDLGTDTDFFLYEVEDYPNVKFDSGTQTLFRSNTGDIDINYGRRLLLRGGSVSAIASGAIQFDNRGDNRVISFKDSYNYYYDIPSSIDITSFNVLTFRTENLGQGEIRVVAESSTVRALTGITLIRNNIDQLLIQGSSATVFRARSQSQFPGIVFRSFDYLTIASFDDSILQYGRVIRYGVLNNIGLLNLESHANTDSLSQFRAVGTTAINSEDFYSSTDGDVNIFSESTQVYNTGNQFAVVASDNILVSYLRTSLIQSGSDINFRVGAVGTNRYYSQTAVQKIQFVGIANQYGYRLPSQDFEDSRKPRVTFNTQLFLRYKRNFEPFYQQALTRGGACLYERAIGFGYSQGVRNVCICLENVWLCGEDDLFYTNPNYYPYKYYKQPFQSPYFGTGPK